MGRQLSFAVFVLTVGLIAASPGDAARRGAKPATRDSGDAATSKSGFMVATPEQIEQAADEARAAAKKMPAGTAEFETDHFRVFTDWPAAEHGGIRESLESSYSAIAKVFGVLPNEDVYVGKLPVYVFAERRAYVKFAQAESHVRQAGGTAGFFQAETRYGFGRLVTFVPNLRDQKVVRELWSHVLVHELTHSFVHRYRSNGTLPLWLNEGLAEFVAAEMHPSAYADNRAIAKDVAAKGHDMVKLMRGKAKGLSYNEYAACQTVVEMMFGDGREKFLGYVGAIKEGTKAEQALADAYGCDYPKLVETWRAWVMRH